MKNLSIYTHTGENLSKHVALITLTQNLNA